MASLADILSRAPTTMLEDYALIRGAVLRSDHEGRFVVQRTPGSHAEWAEFRVEDVMRGPWRLDEQLHELGIRKGATARHVQERVCVARELSRPDRVGDLHYEPVNLVDLVERGPAPPPDEIVLHGVIQPVDDGAGVLVSLPHDHTDCLVIERGDVIDADEVSTERELTTVRLHIRPDARVRVLFQRYREVDRSAPECSGPIQPIAFRKGCKVIEPPGTWDAYCASPGGPCGWFFTGACTNHYNWWMGYVHCECD